MIVLRFYSAVILYDPTFKRVNGSLWQFRGVRQIEASNSLLKHVDGRPTDFS
jgi:hypothetical protein